MRTKESRPIVIRSARVPGQRLHMLTSPFKRFGALVSSADPQQQNAAFNMVRFIAIVLIFSLIARGTAGAKMAKVSLTNPSMGEIVEKVACSGTIESIGNVSPVIPKGVSIDKILVLPGETVTPDTVIATLNEQELSESLKEAKLQLNKMQVTLSQLQTSNPVDGNGVLSAQAAYDWATQDISSAATKGQAAIDSATNTYHKMAAELSSTQTEYDKINADPAATEEAKAAALQTLKAAQSQLDAARAALSVAETSANDANSSAARNAETARQALASAQQANDAAQSTAAQQKAENDADAGLVLADIEKQKLLIASYEAVISGEITAGIDGKVIAIGQERTPDSFAALISDASSGYQIKCTLPESDAAKLSMGAIANLTAKSGYFETENKGSATLMTLSEPAESEMVQAVFRVVDGDVSHGEAVDVEIVNKRADYASIVPSAAVHQDSLGNFVYVMRQQTGVLGTENIVSREPVSVLATDGTFVAIEGSVSAKDQIITSSTKAITTGDKVRVEQ